MNHEDRQAIENVFTRLAEVERAAGARDDEAEAYIHSRLKAQPGSAYYLAQTVVIQQQALEAAQKKISELESNRSAAPPARPAGQFGRSAAASGAPLAPAAAPLSSSGFGRSAGGGFLAGAAQTALGVAGGVLLGNMLGGLFGGGNSAQAAPAPEPDPADEAGSLDAGHEDIGFDDGGDFSLDGDF